MDCIQQIHKLYEKIAKINHDMKNISYINNSEINIILDEIQQILESDYTQYDFYHSYKHYLDLRIQLQYYNLYLSVNRNYYPIITDILIHGQSIENQIYNDFIKIGTGRLNKLTIYSPTTFAISFPSIVM